MLNNTIIKGADQKIGIEMPIKARIIAAESSKLPWFSAAKMPSATPSTEPITNPLTVNSAV